MRTCRLGNVTRSRGHVRTHILVVRVGGGSPPIVNLEHYFVSMKRDVIKHVFYYKLEEYYIFLFIICIYFIYFLPFGIHKEKEKY